MKTKNQANRTKVAVLKSQGLQNNQIADIIGVHKSTITNILNEQRLDMDDALASVRKLAITKIPDDVRVNRLRHLIEQEDHLPTSLNAIESVHKLLYGGRISEGTPQQAGNTPLFSLPAGSRVAISIGPAAPQSTDCDKRNSLDVDVDNKEDS